eukprot:TRINITY_DN9782_c0_g1_i6.p1 TRINITY_DN9782_c0_g1~~TRINITY_DN9782_c0_g1_i6.p1  ORF type:complete len:148 (+),score=41.62 TRINITY_DN9782_c0_g1_i6:231-674(+)
MHFTDATPTERSEADPSGMSSVERLTAFYEQYNPDMLPKVDVILARYRGHEDVLFHKLKSKYCSQRSSRRRGGNVKGELYSPEAVKNVAGFERAKQVADHQKMRQFQKEEETIAKLLANQIALEARISSSQARFAGKSQQESQTSPW